MHTRLCDSASYTGYECSSVVKHDTVNVVWVGRMAGLLARERIKRRNVDDRRGEGGRKGEG